MTDLAALYAAQRERIGTLVSGASAEMLDTPVPACPGWVVVDVVHHLVGLAAHVADGEPGDPADDENTGAAVAARRGRSVADSLAEWDSRGADVQELFPALGVGAYRFVVDTAVHEDDIREAFGLPYATGPAADLMLPSMAIGMAGRRIKKRGLPALQLESTDTDFSLLLGEGDAGGTLRATRDDLARTLAGRRTRTATAALDWTGDPEVWLDALPLFAWAQE